MVAGRKVYLPRSSLVERDGSMNGVLCAACFLFVLYIDVERLDLDRLHLFGDEGGRTIDHCVTADALLF